MNKKKIGLIAVALIALVATATAWSLGNSLSPIEFANMDLNKHNFNPTPKGNEILGEGSIGALLRANIEVDSFTKISENEYEEENKILTVHIGVKNYVNCRNNGGNIVECDANIKDLLIEKAAKRIISEKKRLQEEQIEAKKMSLYASELQAGDITITRAEINAKIIEQTKN